MEQIGPLLYKYVDEHARPLVQAKASEEMEENKVDLKRELPQTVMDYIAGKDEHNEGNTWIASLLAKMGPSLQEKITRITHVTVDTAAEGMDVLLTNGVMNTVKDVLIKKSDQEGGNAGIDFDFLKSGKEGMVGTTMQLSQPIIKQVSMNMSNKLSAYIPKELAEELQEAIDEKGFAGGAVEMAAGFMAKFMNKEGGEDHSKARAEDGGASNSIQQMLHNFLAPKILEIIQPFMDKFEKKMNVSLEDELRNKVFSIEYIKTTVMSMLFGKGGEDGEGGNGGLANVLGSFLNKGGDGKGGDHGGLGALGDFASQFLKR